MGNGAVVNTATLNQMPLIEFPSFKNATVSKSIHATTKYKSGDVGEFFFYLECAKLNIAPYRPALSNSPIDRILVLADGQTKKIHVKTSVICNVQAGKNRRNGTSWESWMFSFKTINSTAKADYFFCCGLDTNYSVTGSWWIPWSLRSYINIRGDGHGFESYLRCPFIQPNLKLGVLPCP